jgi:molybdopterin synthase catalytic subunit
VGEPLITVHVQSCDFDAAALQRSLLVDDAGAAVTFTGYVKSGGGAVEAIELEYYPGMTERAIAAILREAGERWRLCALSVVHRSGYLRAGEQIVWVGASAVHRGDAFAGCEFVMDYLKTRAPFWKKEYGSAGGHWVQARDSDRSRARRWQHDEDERDSGAALAHDDLGGQSW